MYNVWTMILLTLKATEYPEMSWWWILPPVLLATLDSLVKGFVETWKETHGSKRSEGSELE